MNTESNNPSVSDSDPQSAIENRNPKMTAADFESDLQSKIKMLNSKPLPMPGYGLSSESLWLIGSTRLARFLEPFIPELATSPIVRYCPLKQWLPRPHTLVDSKRLLGIFTSPTLLPERLVHTLAYLEAAAAPNNQPLLEAALARHGSAQQFDCALNYALELWFIAPEELAELARLADPPPENPVAAPPTPTSSEPIGRNDTPVEQIQPTPEPEAAPDPDEQHSNDH